MSQIPPERWIGNLIEVASEIADRQHQEERWLAPDRHAWERPEELICDIDGYVLNGFIEKFSATFSEDQRSAALEFRDELSDFCDNTPDNLDPATVLADTRWDVVRQKATAFVKAFKDRWP